MLNRGDDCLIKGELIELKTENLINAFHFGILVSTILRRNTTDEINNKNRTFYCFNGS